MNNRSGNDVKKIVFAGVFKPINESDWRVSILNFANLKMEKKGIINPIKGMKERGCIFNKLSSHVSKLKARIASSVSSLSNLTLFKDK